MYAVIRTGGKQYRVSEGDVIDIERLPGQVDDEVAFDEVLAVQKDGSLQAGAPTVEGARAVGRVLDQGRGRKVLVFKYKSKINYRRRQGHRQSFTRVRIERIEV